MISVEEKLGVFTQYLLRKQREWGKQTINTAKDKKLEMVKASGEKIKEEKRSIEERGYHVIFRDKNKIIAQGKNTAKTELLEEKSRILEDFKQAVLDEARNYVGTEIYRGYLVKCLEKVPSILRDRRDIIIFVNDPDSAFVKQNASKVLPDYTITFDALPAGTIGGIVVRDTDNRINCDFTVENLVRTNYKTNGMHLNEVMEKQVG